MNFEEKDYIRERAARIAASAYNTNSIIPGFTLNEKLSRNDGTRVYKDNTSNSVYIGYRGTQNLRDVASDVGLAIGLEGLDTRFKKSSKILNKVQTYYPDSKIYLAGHSLGGTIVQDTVRKNKGGGDVEGFAFAAGSNPLISSFKSVSDYIGLTRGSNENKVNNYSNLIDPISTGSFFSSNNQNFTRTPIKDFNVHSMKNYLDVPLTHDDPSKYYAVG